METKATPMKIFLIANISHCNNVCNKSHSSKWKVWNWKKNTAGSLPATWSFIKISASRCFLTLCPWKCVLIKASAIFFAEFISLLLRVMLQRFPRKPDTRRGDIHWTRQAQDGDRPRRCIRAETTRTHAVRLWRLKNEELTWRRNFRASKRVKGKTEIFMIAFSRTASS